MIIWIYRIHVSNFLSGGYNPVTRSARDEGNKAFLFVCFLLLLFSFFSDSASNLVCGHKWPQSKTVHISVPLFPHLQVGDNKYYLSGLL